MINKFFKRIRGFAINQNFVPWFIRKNHLSFFWNLEAKFNLVWKKTITSGKTGFTNKCTFLIPHKNCTQYLNMCIDSIYKKCTNFKYEILICDDFSTYNEFSRIKNIPADMKIYRFLTPKGHPFALQWLFYRAHSEYVVILDQDAIIMTKHLEVLFDRFNMNSKLLVLGMLDPRTEKQDKKMLHPSFMLINKKRCDSLLKNPLFFDDKFKTSYKNVCNEKYYSLTLKALAIDSNSVEYLKTIKTKYGHGVFGYLDNYKEPIVYHQWYSGRIYNMDDNAKIDNEFTVKDIKATSQMFIDDYYNNSIKIPKK